MHLLATHFLDPVLEKERNRALTCWHGEKLARSNHSCWLANQPPFGSRNGEKKKNRSYLPCHEPKLIGLLSLDTKWACFFEPNRNVLFLPFLSRCPQKLPEPTRSQQQQKRRETIAEGSSLQFMCCSITAAIFCLQLNVSCWLWISFHVLDSGNGYGMLRWTKMEMPFRTVRVAYCVMRNSNEQCGSPGRFRSSTHSISKYFV